MFGNLGTIKARSRSNTGIVSDFISLLSFGVKERGDFDKRDVWQVEIHRVLNEDFLQIIFGKKNWDTIGLDHNNNGRFDSSNHGKFWRKVGFGVIIKGIESCSLSSIISTSYDLQNTNRKGVWVFVIIMTQGQLIVNSGDGKCGEGMRKRLKISVPHFDNSALVKTFSKTLIGRCMNPVAQDMKALLGNLPKIWKLEDKVVGRDLGMGKFQFDFQTEEDMEGVLKLLPFHFDYWMLSLAKWQAKQSPSFPSDIMFWVRVLGVPSQFRMDATEYWGCDWEYDGSGCGPNSGSSGT